MYFTRFFIHKKVIACYKCRMRWWCPSSVVHLLRCMLLQLCPRRRGCRLPLWMAKTQAYLKLLLHSLFYNSLTDSDVVFDSLFEPLLWTVDYLTRWFGLVFVWMVAVLTTSILLVIYVVLLPNAFMTYSTAWLAWHLCYGHWNLVMIVFHYYKAVKTSPGYPPTEKNDIPFVSVCKKCVIPKPARAHHCGICNRCILKMDHHCRILSHTDYVTPAPYSFKEKIMDKSIIYMWVLTSTVAVVLGALTTWHALLISRGETSIEKHTNSKEKSRMEKMGQVYKNPFNYGKLHNWKLFLGVEKRRHWFTRVLLPSAHSPLGDGLTWDSFPVKKEPIQV
ncbi:palmitoyltransferase ZDHHC16A isoform X3 [Phycodurus eques]|uniref:palmitoyltransferase ZDHHC16A isoform X3 n=1 Tax=Phycodurus eques TaxID=693459 RepID=UPI002ACF03E7|nr:palmitoyltransferase ZDHHC16A isoform X3 [Phycodurus eques]